MVEAAEQTPKLPAEVQKAVDKAHASATKHGLKNAPQPDPQPDAAASAAAMQQSLEHPAPEPEGGADYSQRKPPTNVTPIKEDDRQKDLQQRLTERGRELADAERRNEALQQQVQDTNMQLARLQATVEQMQTAQQPAASQQTDAEPQKPSEPWYTPEQLDDFGEDFFQLVDKRVGAVEQQYRELLQNQAGRIADLEQHITQLNQGVQKATTQPLYAELDKRLPGWRELDADPEFVRWLQNTPVSPFDPSGKTMFAALRANFAAGALDNVVSIFTAYGKQGSEQSRQPGLQQANSAGTQPGGQPPVPPAATVTAAAGQVDLNSLAGPGTPHEPAADALTGPPVTSWTREGIREFYEDVRRGKYSREQTAAIEADLQRAIRRDTSLAGR